MPRLTVILPALDAAATLGLALSSTLRALPRDAELVVLDDGSQDATPQILDRTRDPRVRVLRSEAPSGVAGGLRRLLAETDSELVGRMDADDVCLPWRFHHQLAVHDRLSPAVQFTQVLEFGPRRLRPGAPLAMGAAETEVQLLLRNPMSHPSMLGRRSAIDAVGGYRDVPSEDYDLWLRLAAAGEPVVRTATTGLLYRVHPHQITASASWRERSWHDPLQATAFGDLAQRVLGTRRRRLNVVATDPALTDAELADELDAFGTDVRAAAARLTPRARRRVVATWERRRRQLATLRAARVAQDQGR